MPEVGMARAIQHLRRDMPTRSISAAGSPLGLYLTAAGVGGLSGGFRRGRLQQTGSQRQVIHGNPRSTRLVGPTQTAIGKDSLVLNPFVQIDTTKRPSVRQLPGAFEAYDVIIDATTTFGCAISQTMLAFLLGNRTCYGSIL